LFFESMLLLLLQAHPSIGGLARLAVRAAEDLSPHLSVAKMNYVFGPIAGAGARSVLLRRITTSYNRTSYFSTILGASASSCKLAKMKYVFSPIAGADARFGFAKI
jgi:hypothetical protein